MNNFKLRENKSKIDQDFIDKIRVGFITALIWHDENLDGFSIHSLDYSTNEKCKHTINIFLSLVLTSDRATKQMVDHGPNSTGHDLALQMLGAGVGFWEQENTKLLDIVLSFLLDMKAIKPFILFYDKDGKFLKWDIA